MLARSHWACLRGTRTAGFDDAIATQQVFERLVDLAVDSDPGVVTELARLARTANWPLSRLLDAVAAEQAARGMSHTAVIGGVNITALERRIRSPRRTAASYADIVAADSLPQEPEEMAAALVGPGGALSEIAPKVRAPRRAGADASRRCASV